MPFPPEGSYLQNCRNLNVERGTLTAECQDSTGAWKQTSIGLRECRGAPDIANVNGTLTCEAQPGAGQTPWAQPHPFH